MFKNFMSWIEYRMPFMEKMNLHVMQYPAPKNFNFWYFFGSLAMLVLVNQILTGIWLTMNFVPTSEGAFASVEYIMRDVDYGWLLRYMHSTGASAFFVVVYLHMLRGQRQLLRQCFLELFQRIGCTRARIMQTAQTEVMPLRQLLTTQ